MSLPPIGQCWEFLHLVRMPLPLHRELRKTLCGKIINVPLADLFIHGSAVKVTKDELIDLFAIMVEQVPATVDVAVQSYLFGI